MDKNEIPSLEAYVERQTSWSRNTFGPSARTVGVIDHIRKELKEIEAEPTDASEWADIVILALDGAWRKGFTPQSISSEIRRPQVLPYPGEDIIARLTKAVNSVENGPAVLYRWAIVVILAFHGAMENDISAEDLMEAMEAKYEKNVNRKWPDWRTAPKDQAIEHIRDEEESEEEEEEAEE